MNLDKCKKDLHEWQNIMDSEPFWENDGQSVDWCPVCGTIRKYNTYDGRKVGKNIIHRILRLALQN
jgi:hypothetical protein